MALILVIEDEPDFLEVIRDLLARAHHDVLVASGVRAGIALYRTHRPHLVITDVLLPDESGLNLIWELCRDCRVKVIAISGDGHTGGRDFLQWAEAFGAWRTLQKPFRRQELLEAVSEALANPAWHSA